MKKIYKPLIIYLLIVWPICMFCMISIASGNTCVSYHGFAVDTASNIYLGKNSEIEVLNSNGEAIRSFNSQTSRGYKFTITQDNTIKISTGDFLYETDLFGNVINKKEIHDYTDDDLVGLNIHKFTSSNGTKYIMKNKLFRTRIYRLDGEQKIEIYKMPIFDYIIRLLFTSCGISMVIVTPSLIFKARKTKDYSTTFWQVFKNR